MKKTATALTITCLFFLIITGCNKDAGNETLQTCNVDTLTMSRSMKGWEVYSFTTGSDWYFSILPGTNRVKNREEVINNQVKVKGLNSLKQLISKIPEQEYVFWQNQKEWSNSSVTFALPDNDAVDEIKQLCKEKNLILNVF